MEMNQAWITIVLIMMMAVGEKSPLAHGLHHIGAISDGVYHYPLKLILLLYARPPRIPFVQHWASNQRSFCVYYSTPYRLPCQDIMAVYMALMDVQALTSKQLNKHKMITEYTCHKYTNCIYNYQ
jgi:hypothetical protein